MLATRLNRTSPLPHGWPRRVRSAVVHALRQEIHLLLEELRIKD